MATVPQIADIDRIVDATATAAQTDFIIPWPVIADSEDAAAEDLVVQVNDDPVSSNDFAFIGNVVPGLSGIWNGGTLRLETPCAAGDRVIIYSSRAPRRTGSYLEGKSLPFTELDKLMDDFCVQMRDLQLHGKRAVTISVRDLLDGDDPNEMASRILDAAATAKKAEENIEGMVGPMPGYSIKGNDGATSDFPKNLTVFETRKLLTKTINLYREFDFGRAGNTAAENTAAWQAAVASIAGGDARYELLVPRNLGTINVEVGDSWSLQSHIRIINEAGNILTRTDISPNNWFLGQNVDDITVEGEGYFVGNGLCTANQQLDGNLFQFWFDDNLLRDLYGFRFLGFTEDNFKGDGHIFLQFIHPRQYDVGDIRIEGTRHLSRVGNARGPTNGGIPSACVYLQGSSDLSTKPGKMVDAWIGNNFANIPDMKGFFYGILAMDRITLKGQHVKDVASASAITPDTANSYVYTLANETAANLGPTNVDISNVIVEKFGDAGVFQVDHYEGSTVKVSNSYFGGQRLAAVRNSLPGGALVPQEGKRFEAYNNTAESCFDGLSATYKSAGTQVISRGLTVLNGKTNGAGIRLGTDSGASGTAYDALLQGTRVQSANAMHYGMRIPSGGLGTPLGKLIIDDFQADVPDNCIYIDKTGALSVTPAIFNNVRLYGGKVGQWLMRSITSRVEITGLRSYRGTQIAANTAFGGNRCLFGGSTDVHINGAHFDKVLNGTNNGSGTNDEVAFDGNFSTAASGSMRNVTFSNDTDASLRATGGGFGTQAPTDTSVKGTFVQNLDGGDQLAPIGWKYNGAAWGSVYEAFTPIFPRVTLSQLPSAAGLPDGARGTISDASSAYGSAGALPGATAVGGGSNTAPVIVIGGTWKYG